MSKKENLDKNGISYCERKPDKYKPLSEFLSESDDSNKEIGKISNYSLLATEASVIILIVSTIVMLVKIFSSDLFTPISNILAIILYVLLMGVYIYSIVYSKNYLYISNVKKNMIISIVTLSLYFIEFVYFILGTLLN